MNKFTKGALAAGAGIVLLLGGAGSLAYWNATADLTSGSISSGSLTAESDGDGAFTPELDAIVPGDVVTYTETITVTGEGENLWVSLELTEGAISATTAADPEDEALAAALIDSASFTVDGAAYTAGDAINIGTGTSEIVVSIDVTFPFGSSVDNATQSGTVDFDDFGLTVTQEPVPVP